MKRGDIWFSKHRRKDIVKPLARQYLRSPLKFMNFLDKKKRWWTAGRIILIIIGIFISLGIILMVGQIGNPLTTKQAQGIAAPEFTGIETWINSIPLNFSYLEGKLVLVNFWSYSCGESLNDIPYLKELHEKYSDKGLVIVGVHSPEFEFEKDAGNVRAVVIELDINYPVAVDSSLKTKEAYEIAFCPAFFLIDQKGIVKLEHRGKDEYKETETMIRDLLEEAGENVRDIDIGAEEVYESGPLLSPKIYASYKLAKTGLGNEEGYIPENTQNYSYVADEAMDENKLYLYGSWYNAEDYLKHDSTDEGHMAVKYHAKEVDIVASGNATARVLLDGEVLGREMAGDDIFYENGDSMLEVSEGKLYSLVRGDEAGTHVIRLLTKSRGFRLFSFSFK